MKERLLKWFRILLTLLLILGLFVVGRQSMNYKSGQQDYNEAEQLANHLSEDAKQLAPSVETVLTQPDAEDPYAAALREEIDLSALKAVNRDVQGWIDIPGTEISYPVLQGTDNDFYLNHTWKKDAN